MLLPVLSHFQASPLLKALEAGEVSALTSVDLNLNTIEVSLTGDTVTFPGGETLNRDQLAMIAGEENSCFVLEDGEPRKIQVFSETTSRYYSLMPTKAAPTMLISGIPMHRIKD